MHKYKDIHVNSMHELRKKCKYSTKNILDLICIALHNYITQKKSILEENKSDKFDQVISITTPKISVPTTRKITKI